jgi:hypothetical protein
MMSIFWSCTALVWPVYVQNQQTIRASFANFANREANDV